MEHTTLVIGCARGLGLEFVRQLSAKGGKVLATVRNTTECAELSAIQRGAPFGVVRILELDFTSKSSIEALTKSLSPIDTVIVNAGINGNRSPLLDEEDLSEDLATTFATNVLGPINLVKAVLPFLGKGAKVVLLSSRLASMAEADMDLSPSYSISKAALNMAGRKMAVELKPKGIIVLLQAPGWVKSDMGGSNAPLEPQESITGMLEVIENSGLEKTGKFYNYNSNEMQW